MTTASEIKTPKKRTHRSAGRRLSKEHQQEYRSRGQVDERLSEYGWVVNDFGRDHGEDMHVAIYDDGRSTGLTFLLQCKSTCDGGGLVPKKDKRHIRYPLEVADLMHWEIAAQVVIVLVWDVERRQGWWATVPSLVGELDKSKKNWRSQKKVRVSIPVRNSTSDHGLHRLRQKVADHSLPVVGRGKTMVLKPTFVFPKTREGREKLAELKRTLDTGTPVTIDGKYISGIVASDWFERLYGSGHYGNIQSITIAPRPGKKTAAFRLEVEDSGGSDGVVLPLRLVRGGEVEMEFSNAHEEGPLNLKLVMNWADSEVVNVAVNLTNELPHPSVYATRDAARFLLRLRRASTVRLINLESGSVVLETGAWNATGQTEDELRWWAWIADMLCAIQPRIRKFGTLSLKRDGQLSEEDVEAITKMYEICRTGRVNTRGEFRFTLTLNAKSREQWMTARGSRSNGSGALELRVPSTSVRVLGLEIPLGEMVLRIPDASEALKQVAAALGRNESEVAVVCPDVRMTQEYPEWPPMRRDDAAPLTQEPNMCK